MSRMAQADRWVRGQVVGSLDVCVAALLIAALILGSLTVLVLLVVQVGG
jgi:hypothetical protein